MESEEDVATVNEFGETRLGETGGVPYSENNPREVAIKGHALKVGSRKQPPD